MISTVLQIRLKQALRMLGEIGWILGIILIPLLLIFFLGVLESALKNPNPQIGIVVLLLLAYLHTQRNDHGFLKKVNSPTWLIYFAEYTCLVLPLTIGLILLGNFQNALILHLGILPLSLIPIKAEKGLSWLKNLDYNFIPTTAFEWKFGLRKMGVFLIPMYFFGLALSNYTLTVLLIVFLLGSILPGFYDNCESKEIFEKAKLGTSNFLLKKVGLHLLVFHCLMLPLYCCYLFFHAQYWYLLPAVMLLTSMLITFGIVYKYAHFFPGRASVNNSMSVGIFFMFSMVPFLAPVGIGYIIYYWRKARFNLNKLYA